MTEETLLPNTSELLDELTLDELLELQVAVEKKLAYRDGLYEELLGDIEPITTPGNFDVQERLYGIAVAYYGEDEIICVLKGKTAKMGKFLKGFNRI